MAKNRDHEIVRHHIVPSSRGGTDETKNIAQVERKTHDLYHQLFENMTPHEIIVYLTETFWNDQTFWLPIAELELAKRKKERG